MIATVPTARVIIVGSEILEGRLDEANLRAICEPLRRAGVEVDRAVVVPDDLAVISEQVSAAVDAPRPRLLVVAGGTGGTWDDVTYAAVAQALGRPRTPVAAITERLDEVLDFTRRAGYELDRDAIDSMMNIASVPEGSDVTVVDDWLVAVTVHVNGGMDDAAGLTVLVLPGPPGQCARLVQKVLVEDLLAGRRSEAVTVQIEHDYPETLLVGCIVRARQRYPSVAVGSYPGRPTVVRLAGPETDAHAFAALVRAGIAELDAHPAAPKLRAAWGSQDNWTRG